MGDFIIKTYTTGLNPYKDNLIKLSVRYIDKSINYNVYFRFNNYENIIKESTFFNENEKNEFINEIKNKGISFNQSQTLLNRVFVGNNIIGFNIGFDMNFILYNLNLNMMSLDLSNTNFVDLLEIQKEMYKMDFESVLKREQICPIDYDKYCESKIVEKLDTLYKDTKLYHDDYFCSNSYVNSTNSLEERDGQIYIKGGMYSGKTVEYVKKNDIKYFNWLLSSTNDFRVKDILNKIKTNN